MNKVMIIFLAVLIVGCAGAKKYEVIKDRNGREHCREVGNNPTFVLMENCL